MNPKHRVFWEWLADQYEEWADNPPTSSAWGTEIFTCDALSVIFMSWIEPEEDLLNIWQFRYGAMLCPAGDDTDIDRPEKRHEFCWWMADTIREYLDTGKGPWETD